MTESEWLACIDPITLQKFLQDKPGNDTFSSQGHTGARTTPSVSFGMAVFASSN
jgi:hypothetical protein